jgi:hypothetical protein
MLWYSVQWKSLIDTHNQTSLGCVDEVSIFLLPDFVGDSSMGACYPFPLQAVFISPQWRTPAVMHLKTLFLLSYNFSFNQLHSFSMIQIRSIISIFCYIHSIIHIHSTRAKSNYGHSILCIYSNLHGCSAKNSSIWMSIHMNMHIMHINVHNVLMLGYAAKKNY